MKNKFFKLFGVVLAMLGLTSCFGGMEEIIVADRTYVEYAEKVAPRVKTSLYYEDNPETEIHEDEYLYNYSHTQQVFYTNAEGQDILEEKNFVGTVDEGIYMEIKSVLEKSEDGKQISKSTLSSYKIEVQKTYLSEDIDDINAKTVYVTNEERNPADPENPCITEEISTIFFNQPEKTDLKEGFLKYATEYKKQIRLAYCEVTNYADLANLKQSRNNDNTLSVFKKCGYDYLDKSFIIDCDSAIKEGMTEPYFVSATVKYDDQHSLNVTNEVLNNVGLFIKTATVRGVTDGIVWTMKLGYDFTVVVKPIQETPTEPEQPSTSEDSTTTEEHTSTEGTTDVPSSSEETTTEVSTNQ